MLDSSMIRHMSVDFTGLGFLLATPDVADILRKTEHEIHDLVRTGLLSMLTRKEPGEPIRMWFHPDDVSEAEVALRDSTRAAGLTVDTRNRLRVAAALRDYLAEVPPERSYDLAMLRNAPLLGRTRQREEVAHVRPEAVAAHGSEGNPVSITISMVTQALEFFGAIRVRGITALDEPGKQRWGVWFRLPPGFTPGDDDEPEVIDGLMAGAFEQGDRISRRAMGPAVLTAPLRGLDDED